MKTLHAFIVCLVTIALFSMAFANAQTSKPSKYDTNYFTDANELGRKQKVLLLTSIDMTGLINSLPSILFFAKKKLYNFNSNIEKRFREYFEAKNYEVEVYHYVSQDLLWLKLISGEYTAIYWMSHGGKASKDLVGVSSGGLFDHQNYDITDILKEVHPNVRVLGTIGCFSQDVAEKMKGQFEIDKKNPQLYFISFDDKIDAVTGLNLSMKWGSEYMDRDYIKSGYRDSTPSTKALYVQFSRKCEANNGRKDAMFPSIRFEANKQTIAVLGSCKLGEEQTTYGHIPVGEVEGDTIAKNKLKIVVKSGTRPLMAIDDMERISLGQLKVHRFNRQEWSIFKDPESGVPFGVFEHIFNYKGPAIPKYLMGDHKIFKSRKIPPRFNQ